MKTHVNVDVDFINVWIQPTLWVVFGCLLSTFATGIFSERKLELLINGLTGYVPSNFSPAIIYEDVWCSGALTSLPTSIYFPVNMSNH